MRHVISVRRCWKSRKYRNSISTAQHARHKSIGTYWQDEIWIDRHRGTAISSFLLISGGILYFFESFENARVTSLNIFIDNAKNLA